MDKAQVAKNTVAEYINGVKRSSTSDFNTQVQRFVSGRSAFERQGDSLVKMALDNAKFRVVPHIGKVAEDNKKLEEENRFIRQENTELQAKISSFTKNSELWKHQRVIRDDEIERVWGRAQNNFIRVFISHKTENKREVAKIKEELRFYGFNCFVAHEDIEATQEWQTEIENALLTMDAFVAILTKTFHESNWTDQEIGFACARNVPKIAVRMGSDPYGFIGRFQGLSSDWEKLPLDIFKQFKTHPKMVDAWIDALKICPTAYVANDLAALLPYFQRLTDAQLKKLIENYNSNSQVCGSYEMRGHDNIEKSIIPHLERCTGKKFEFVNYRINYKD